MSLQRELYLEVGIVTRGISQASIMHRFELVHLKQWKTRTSRNPVVIHGARQVGKSFLVGMFAADEFAKLHEVNFERNPVVPSLFDSKSPKTVVAQVKGRFDVPVTPGKTLLFLDQIHHEWLRLLP